jgi:hypothetical protein
MRCNDELTMDTAALFDPLQPLSVNVSSPAQTLEVVLTPIDYGLFLDDIELFQDRVRRLGIRWLWVSCGKSQRKFPTNTNQSAP